VCGVWFCGLCLVGVFCGVGWGGLFGRLRLYVVVCGRDIAIYGSSGRLLRARVGWASRRREGAWFAVAAGLDGPQHGGTGVR